MLVFVKQELADSAAALEISDSEERVWLSVHSDHGPYLVRVWYRAPDPGQTKGVDTLKEELVKHREASLGTLAVGDFNVHNRKWLVHSAKNSPE